MNLAETLALEDLRSVRPNVVEKTFGRNSLVKEVFRYANNEDRDLDATRNEWSERFLASSRFTLTDILTNHVANPGRKITPKVLQRVMAQNMENPVVVDFNKNKIAVVTSINYVPRAIVVDGREKFAIACSRGYTRLRAWVGDKVLDYIRADHSLSSDELYELLSARMRDRFPEANNNLGYIIIEKVYPFEGYFIYNKLADYITKRYRQSYVVSADKEVTLTGQPQEVSLEYLGISASRALYTSGTLNHVIQLMHACNATCGCVAAKRDTCISGTCTLFNSGESGERTITLRDLMKISSGMKGSKKAKIRAASPPGWEDTVKHMKEHEDISNPYALAWYGYKQGFTPHSKEK